MDLMLWDGLDQQVPYSDQEVDDTWLIKPSLAESDVGKKWAMEKVASKIDVDELLTEVFFLSFYVLCI
jgi:hypothetical protein